MTAVFTTQIQCDRDPAHVYPDTPVRDAKAKNLRTDASAVGWDIQRGNKGRDVCPPCRIEEFREGIQALAGVSDDSPAA